MANTRNIRPLPVSQALVLAALALEAERSKLDPEPTRPASEWAEWTGAIMTVRQLIGQITQSVGGP